MSQPRRLNSESTVTSDDTLLTAISENEENHADNLGELESQQQRPRYHDQYARRRSGDQNGGNRSREFTMEEAFRCDLGEKIRLLLVFVVTLLVSVVISFLISSVHTKHLISSHEYEHVPRNEMVVKGEPAKEKDKDLCFRCPHLRVSVKQAYWRGVVIDRVLDECCFKDKFHVLVTFKFYADVKLSEYQSELSSLKDSVNELYSMVYTMTNKPQGEKPNVTLPMSPIMKETIASLTQKKRSILYLKSNRIRQTRHGSRIEWSDEPVTSPLLQGNLGLLSGDSTHIEIAETGVYTIRAEVKFVSNDEIETGLTLLEYHVKARSFNGHLTPIESFTEQIRFSQERSEFHGIVHTVAQLNQGDVVLVHLPRPAGGAIVSETVGAHRITVIEET